MSNKRQPSRHARQLVRDAFNPDTLKYLCTTWDLDDYADRVDLTPGRDNRERFYYYADNGADVLAVAHLDSVQSDGTCAVTDTSAGLLAASGALDDRLGVYVILELLPALGITTDILLTTDEEIGASTADSFDTDKQYRWLFQFDRGGTDVVMYDYETPALVKLVESCGARVGVGSFSDICYLEHLQCAGFNWGVGYRDYHGPRSHAWLEDTFRSVARFAKFYKANAASMLAHEPRERWSWSASSWSSWYQQSEIAADCGHGVDLGDERTYMELEGGSLIVCTACGTMPATG